MTLSTISHREYEGNLTIKHHYLIRKDGQGGCVFLLENVGPVTMRELR